MGRKLLLGVVLLAGIVTLLSVTAWITVVQRMAYVHRTTRDIDDENGSPKASSPAPLQEPSSSATMPNNIETSSEVPARS